MKKIFVMFLMSCFMLPLMAQQKANYKQALVYEKTVDKFDNDLRITPHFIHNTDKFWYRHKTTKLCQYFIVDPKKHSKKLLFDTEYLVKRINEISKEEHKLRDFTTSTLEFSKDEKTVSIYFDGNNYGYNRITKKVKKLPKEKSKIRTIPYSHIYSPDSLWLMYTYKHNLFLYGNKEKGMDPTEIQLTKDGTRYNSYARFPKLSDNEQTTPQGRWLNSKYFLIEVEDNTKIGTMSIIESLHLPYPRLISYPYSIAGDTCVAHYGLKVVDIEKRTVRELNLEKWKDQYITYLSSSKDGNKLYFFRIKRTWQERELCEYDLSTDKLRVILSETDDKYFDFEIGQTHFINDHKEIILRSERTGNGHFYLYDTETGKLKRTLTEGDYVTGQMQKYDAKNRMMYFYAYGKEKDHDPYNKQLCCVNLDHGDVRCLTPEDANHKITFTPSGKYIIDNFSRVDLEPRAVVRDLNGKKLVELDSPDLQELYDMGWQKPERFKVKAADGKTDLYGVMWKPMDFDPNKKYPIISEVYPGPQFEYVPVSFCVSDSYASALSQLGFIVIQCGHRGGSPIRGGEYFKYGYGNMRDYALADDKAAIENLAKERPYIDIKKVGIYGHSGGGCMSVTAICKYPDFYTAAVSGAGNHDNTIFNTSWTELNTGIHEVYRDSVKKDEVIGFKVNPVQTNLGLAPKCKGHILLAHGMMDDNVNPAHAFRMAKALIDAGKNFEFVVLPSANHGFFGVEGKFFTRKLWRHFAKYLMDDFSGEKIVEMDKLLDDSDK